MTNHGATLFKGSGFWNHSENNMVYSVIGSEEMPRIIKAIRDIDENAFINVQKTDQISGNFYRKPTE